MMKTNQRKIEDKMKKKGALPVGKWLKKSEKYWLKIEDVEKLPVGHQLVVLTPNRNWGIPVPETLKNNTTYRPETFFRPLKETWTYEGDLKYSWNGEKRDFEIEYDEHSWYPLGELGDFISRYYDILKVLRAKTHWTQYPKDTHVGHRGPIILWSDLKKLPKIFVN